MKRTLVLVIVAMIWTGCLFAQNEKPKKITETLYLIPKSGKADKFEAAVKAHNLKYHPDGPYYAALRLVDYGEMAGWYVWIMRGTYASLDTRPGKGAHNEDWNKTVDPFVEKYGSVGLWEYNEDLSYGMDIFNKSDHYQVWAVDLKKGENYRFKTLIERMVKVYESMGNRAFLIFDNAVHSSNSPDVAIVWSFNKFEDLDGDWGTKEAYEKLYGEGTWQNLMDEWSDIHNDYDMELRTMIK